MPPDESTGAATARGRRTRDALLDATVELVAARGFHAVGISEIGAAAGVSGAAIYRHFATKDDLLVAVFDRVVGELLAGAARATDTQQHHDPASTLGALVDAHIAFAIHERAVITIYDQEAHNLPAEQRRRVRRQQATYAALWLPVVARAHPTWTPDQVTVAVHAAFGLMNSVADHRSTAPIADQAAWLRSMTLAALGISSQ